MTTLTKTIKATTESTSLLKAEPGEPTRLDVVKTNFVAQNVLQNRSDIRVIGALKEPRRHMGADGPLQPIVDLSSIGRNGAVVAGGIEWIAYDPSTDLSQPLMGLTLATFLVSATAQTIEAAKRYNYADKIGDVEGKRLALASMGIYIPLAGAGGTALLKNSLQVYDLAQTLQNVNYQPVAEVSQSISVLGTITLALFGLYNAVLTAISAFSLYQKHQMMNEVEKVSSVRGWLYEKLELAVDSEVEKHSEKEFAELALEEGEKWLTKLEKDWKTLGLEPLSVSKEKRKQLIKDLFLKNDDMAKFTGISDKRGQDLIIAFGKKLMTERLRAGAEQKLSRTIGQSIIDKYNTTTEQITKMEVMNEIDKGMDKNRWLIFLGVLGVLICIAAIVFTGGIAALAVSMLFVLSAVLWIYGWDGNRLIQQWNGEQTGKFDKAMLIFSTFLNIVAVVGTIVGMIIFTGGIALIPLVLLVLVGLFWAVVNVRGIYTYARHSSRPWEYEKVVTLNSFHKLTQKEVRDEEIEKYFKKMSQADQNLFQGSRDWKKVTPIIINNLANNRITQLQDLNRYTRSLIN